MANATVDSVRALTIITDLLSFDDHRDLKPEIAPFHVAHEVYQKIRVIRITKSRLPNVHNAVAVGTNCLTYFLSRIK